ncbi:MAG TPA: asparagine synthase-related protein, partial [Vicinamibacteria bacterium]|nr:asparagine synthase-related protein [Vicinamibacteria bacterium]
MEHPVERVVDLLDPASNHIQNMSGEEARRLLFDPDPRAVRAIDGSFALVARDGIVVRMARSLDRPMRYFLAKRQAGPALFVADRIDALRQALSAEGLEGQFHPSYTRMVPAHHVVELRLVGCPDPDPTYTRFFTPPRGVLPKDLDEIGRLYVGALADQIARWLKGLDASASPPEPIGVAFSGGVDSGSVFLVTYHVMRRLGLSPSRLKAFVLNLGAGPDVAQAREFLRRLDLEIFLEEIEAQPGDLDVDETLRVLEDYKPLDVECAAVGLLLCRGIRARYPEWRHLLDGDGGDENLKDYPIEESSELTIKSVIDNAMLYQEGWGVGRIKHSLTYSGGLSRSYARTYAPARHFGFAGFSPYTRPRVLEVAEGIPFATLTAYGVPALYALKGEVVRRGVKAVTGLDMPVFPKRRFQHGALPAEALRHRLGGDEAEYRRRFLALYS